MEAQGLDAGLGPLSGQQGEVEGMGRRPASAATPPLSREAVISAALEEIDENGLAAFSLRTLAKRLGIYPSSIYWHVANREEMLAEVLAQALASTNPEQDHADWRDFVRDLFVRFRAAIRRHPNIAPLVASNLMINISMDLTFAERTLAALRQAGFDGDRLIAAFNLLMATLIGFAPQEFSPTPSEANERWEEAMIQKLAAVPADRYPVVAAGIESLRNRSFFFRWLNGVRAPFDDTYPMAVEFLIAGLEAEGRKAQRP